MDNLLRPGSFSRRVILITLALILVMGVSTLTYQSHDTLKESFEVVLPNGTKIKQNVEEQTLTLPRYSIDLKAKYDFGQGEIEYEVCPGARIGSSQFSIVGCLDTDLNVEGGVRYEW